MNYIRYIKHLNLYNTTNYDQLIKLNAETKMMIMKSEEGFSELFFQDKHILCSTYTGTLNTSFRYIKLKQGQRIISKTMPRHNLIMLRSGVLNISCGANKLTLQEWQMIVISKSTRFEAMADNDAEVLLFGFDLPTTGCDRNCLKEHINLCNKMNYNFKPTKIKGPINIFIDLMITYLSRGINCPHMHESKHRELFLCFKSFYSDQEVAYLMYPIIMYAEDFKSVILENIAKFTCTNDMIELTNMSRARFFVKFKKEFKMTAKQWMLKHKLDEIKVSATTPNVTVKGLMLEFGFDTSSQFSQFCKRHFECLPSDLIRMHQSDTQ